MAKKTQQPEILQKRRKNKLFALAKKISAGKSYVYQETFKNVGKSMVCCDLSLVRGTQSPERIQCTTFGFRLNPWKIIGIPCFSCGACLSGHRDARLGSCVACKILRLSENLQNLDKTCFPPLRLGACQKKLRQKQADVSLGLVGRDKVHNMKCNITEHDNVLP